MDRLPLPNSVSCPALDLFRRYKYPDSHTVEQFKNPVIVEIIKNIVEATIINGTGEGGQAK